MKVRISFLHIHVIIQLLNTVFKEFSEFQRGLIFLISSLCASSASSITYKVFCFYIHYLHFFTILWITTRYAVNLAVYVVNVEIEASFYGFITVELQKLNGRSWTAALPICPTPWNKTSHPMEQNVPPHGTKRPTLWDKQMSYIIMGSCFCCHP